MRLLPKHCGPVVYAVWGDIDSPRKLSVELGCLARMTCREAVEGNGFLSPPFPGLRHCETGFPEDPGHSESCVGTECDVDGDRCGDGVSDRCKEA